MVKTDFMIARPEKIKEMVSKELSKYNYTFPVVTGPGPSGAKLPRRTRPYRNDRIITAIRDIFFTGGPTSFARRFASSFPTHQGFGGVDKPEVPVPMVALVATAVRSTFIRLNCCANGNLNEQLYAALYEWRSGTHQFMDFSANAFLDVYDGHINTFQHIQKHRNKAFHIMMEDIYSQAR